MKKLCLTILIFAVIVFSAMVPSFAIADSDTHNYNYTPSHGGYKVTTLVDNGTPVGVRFYGFYFGNSGITVTAEIYSTPNLPLNFCVGDADFGTSTSGFQLTAEQTAAKHTILDLFEKFHQLIKQTDAAANTQYDGSGNLPTSDIYRYNIAKQGTELQISAETFEMLTIARQMYQDTNGAFNPAVYRLVDLWGFSSRIYANGDFGLPYDRVVTASEFVSNGYPLPEQKYVDAFSSPQFTDFSQSAVTLSQRDGNYYVTKNVAPAVVDGVQFDQWLDLGGIAKGYVVDGMKAMLQELGIQNYYIDAGGSSSALGLDYNGKKQTLWMADPFSPTASIFPEVLLGFEVDKCSVSTSGQYVRKYVTNGVEYAHIIDGTTGAPAQTGVKAVLVAVPEENGLWAGKSDCLTTALTVMGCDKIVEFANGYLKQQGITVVVAYETFDGQKQILSNLEKNQVLEEGKNLAEFGWSMAKDKDGNYVYDETAKFQSGLNLHKTLIIVLACAIGAGVVGIVVYHFVRGKKSALQKVQCARHDKPFKPADVGVYIAVLLLIVVLFSAFFGGEQTSWTMVSVLDMETGEELLVYNAVRNEYKINTENSNGWTVEVSDDGQTFTFSRQFDGETRFNKIHIVRGATPSVKMTDSLCGFHQDCVHTFGEVKVVGGAIVCSPNRLKITTK